ncbi:SLATT domain-containing protein [Nostoc sp.]|uniref:SLATT domain-containing protein n=1 Tax=Nostoc sp. TaxID=1180 RepID=UPI002FFBB82C
MNERASEVIQIQKASQVALEHCKKWEKYYRLSSTGFQWAYFISQFAAVALSGITPILILMDNTPKYVQAIPPAIASISASLAVYNWRSSWVRSRCGANSLENERLNFELRIGSDYSLNLPDEVAIENFRKNVMRVQNQTLEEWEKIVVKESEKSNISQQN